MDNMERLKAINNALANKIAEQRIEIERLNAIIAKQSNILRKINKIDHGEKRYAH